MSAAMLACVCKPCDSYFTNPILVADIIIILLYAIQIEFIDPVAYGSFNLNAPTPAYSIIEYDTHKLLI